MVLTLIRRHLIADFLIPAARVLSEKSLIVLFHRAGEPFLYVFFFLPPVANAYMVGCSITAPRFLTWVS